MNPAINTRLRNTRKTECGAGQLPIHLAGRAAPFALLRNTRKTECGGGQLPIHLAGRAAPFALLRKFLAALVACASPFALLKEIGINLTSRSRIDQDEMNTGHPKFNCII
jgi:hypothetical protein